ncbi:MAG TPA: hypothetical protein VL992_18415 [Tepidisphaeraceae bacterium]|nr:hypothetical protein [Tepidisphaeraceae bacterium]
MRDWFRWSLGALLCLAASSFAATISDDALRVAIEQGGVQRIVLNGSLAVTAPPSPGKWRQGLYQIAAYPPAAGSLALSPLRSRSISQSSGVVTVTDHFDQLSAAYDWSLHGNDLNERITIQNFSDRPYGDPIMIALPSFSFSGKVGGNLCDWTADYVAFNQSFHPSVWMPLAAQYAYDATWGLCMYSPSRIARPTLFTKTVTRVGSGEASAVTFYAKESVPPKQTDRIDITIRITPQSADVDLSNLLASYIRDYQAAAGPLRYVPDDRPLVQFVSFDTGHVTPTDPLGYNGANRRLDQIEGVWGFERMVAPSESVTAGTIFWQPQGVNPRGVQYRPDFDIWPGLIALPDGQVSDVQANLPRLIRWYHQHHLRFGLCARPEDYIVAASAKTDKTEHLDVANAPEMARLLARFDHMNQFGVDLYYLDSFGADLNSVAMMKQIRTRLGPNVPTYSEMTSDLMLPYSGVYSQTTDPPRADGSTTWYSPETFRIFRLLQPHCSILLTGINNSSGGPIYTVSQLGHWKMTPMVEDFLVRRYVLYFRDLQRDYMVNGQWK